MQCWQMPDELSDCNYKKRCYCAGWTHYLLNSFVGCSLLSTSRHCFKNLQNTPWINMVEISVDTERRARTLQARRCEASVQWLAFTRVWHNEDELALKRVVSLGPFWSITLNHIFIVVWDELSFRKPQIRLFTLGQLISVFQRCLFIYDQDESHAQESPRHRWALFNHIFMI